MLLGFPNSGPTPEALGHVSCSLSFQKLHFYVFSMININCIKIKS